MRAVVCTRYGPPEVLELRELEQPVPKPDQVRVKIHATAVTSSDCIIRSFRVPRSMWILARLVLGITRPRRPVLGLVLAGEVDAVGREVRSFKEGDAVFGFDPVRFGTYAEYKCLPEQALLAAKPTNASYEEAAAIPYGGLLALHFLRKAKIQSGQQVLVYGASGAVGTAALQLAKHSGGVVTGVASSGNLALLRSLGADAVLDYTQQDFTRQPERYDLVFVAVGNRVHPPRRADCIKALARGGKYVSVDRGRPRLSPEDLGLLKGLVQAGALRPVIDRRYPLEQIVEAHRYVDKGHAKGTVVIRITEPAA